MSDQLTDRSTSDCEHVIDALTRSLGDQLLVSQDRCVDGLLDVYNVAPSDVVRDLATSAIGDIRHLTAVRTADISNKLDEITAALAIEDAFRATALSDSTVDDDPMEEATADA